MVLEYFTSKKSKQAAPETSDVAKSPLLNDEDEQFLQKITSAEDEAPPLPEQTIVILDNGEKVAGKDAQTALMAGADKMSLPKSPGVEGELVEGNVEESTTAAAEEKKKTNYWSYVPQMPSMPAVPAMPAIPSLRFGKDSSAADFQAAVDVSKSGGVEAEEARQASEAQAKKEQEDMTSVLDRLNLSAVNNRIFSFSKESQKLMEEFTLILKDIVNGVPTAYDDLEKLLTRSEGQLTAMFASMPPFLQTLVKSMPAKMTGTLGPELLAAASGKAGADAKMMDTKTMDAGPSKTQSKQKKSRIPTLKSLVSEKGAVATMLRSILNFLKLRFPAFLTGTNVLMSLAVFLLLFVFWYCHKRGRETRLSKEQIAAGVTESPGESDLEESAILEKPTDPPITINDDPAIDEKPSTVLEEMPAALSHAPPSQVSLPESPSEEKKAVKI